jgi:endonuclease G
MNNKRYALLLIICVLANPVVSKAHPGGMNAEGCHKNKKTGEHHCHTSKAHPSVKAQDVHEKSSEPVIRSNAAPSTQQGKVVQLDYEGFTVWLDCTKRGPIKFRYTAQHDTGNFKRAQDFYFDPDVPAECQQKSTKAYGHGYDRGHQVPANHLDSSATAINQTNFITNILPQTSQMNRGGWGLTEEIVECYRVIDELLVIGGVIWGSNPSDDYFLDSHGVETPGA